MALTPEQIERVREIIGYRSYSATETLLASLNAVQETNTVDDIDEWEINRDKYTSIKNGLLGANKDPAERRLAIRNRVRLRLGLNALTDESEIANPVEIVYQHPAEAAASGCCGPNGVEEC